MQRRRSATPAPTGAGRGARSRLDCERNSAQSPAETRCLRAAPARRGRGTLVALSVTRSKSSARASRGPSPRRSQPPPGPSLSGVQPRFAGITSFLRRPGHDQAVPPVDVLLCGAPFDGGTSCRPGARFGPRAVREASALSRSYSQALGVDIFAELTVADGGDVGGSPHDVERALD